MKLRDIMSTPAVRIHPSENVAVAARTMERYNIGAMPVCGSDGRLYGIITDRDIVTRCIASGKRVENTKVEEVMTANIIAVRPDLDVSAAAAIMGRKQVRRLPVMENGKLCGMVSLGDIALKEDGNLDAADALVEISSHLSCG